MGRSAAVIYVRKSRVKKGQPDPASPEYQEAECRKLAERLGYSVADVDVFRDAEGHRSGRNENREGLRDALVRCEQPDAAALIVYKYNRLARKTRFLLQLMSDLQDKGVLVKAVVTQIDVSTPQGYAMLTVNAAFDQLLADEVGDDRRKAIDHLRRHKGRHYGYPPFGTVRRPQNGDLVLTASTRPQANGTDHAALVRVYELYAAGDASLRTVAERLNTDGWRYRNRQNELVPWRSETVRTVLANHWLYSGYVSVGRAYRDQKELLPGSHGQLVPEHLTTAIAGMFASYKRGLTRRAPFVYPLTGLLYCAACGQRLAGEGREGRRYYRHPLRCPSGGWLFNADKLEAQARAHVAARPFPADMLAESDEQVIRIIAAEQGGGGLAAEKARIETALERLRELYTWGDIDAALYRSRKAELEAKIPRAVTLPAPADVMLMLPTIADGIERMNPREFAALMRSLYDRLEARPHEITAYMPKPWCAAWA